VTTQAQVLDPAQKPKQPPSQFCSRVLSYALFCLYKYSAMPYQVKTTGDAMQGPFVQESKKIWQMLGEIL